MRSASTLGMRPSLPFVLYWWRLRQRTGQELLAAAGIAVGVALVFGVLVANSSITSSAKQVVNSVVGNARLQLAARSEDGFPESTALEVNHLEGVKASAAVLRASIAVVGPRGRSPAELLGVNAGVISLGSLGARDFARDGLRFTGGLILPSGIASAIGATPGANVTVLASGSVHRVRVGAVLQSSLFSSLASSPIAITLLPTAQSLTGKFGRVTQIFIEPRPGADAVVSKGLQELAAGRLDVLPATNELSLLDKAIQPNRQSTTLFALISAMVGFLLAFNAMLLTIPERRRFIAELRTFGYDGRQVLMVLGVQALLLGIAASVAGIALGYGLSRTLFNHVPGYLAFAFPIGTQKTIGPITVLAALVCGVGAASVASLAPLFDLRRTRALDAVLRERGEAGQGISRRAGVLLGVAAVTMTAVAAVVALAVPSLTALGGVILAFAAVCVIPVMYTAMINFLAPLSERVKGMLSLAVVELESTATRSIALAAVAALSVYGSVAIGGARYDLTRGLETAIAEDSTTADLWVTTGQNVFNTDSFLSAGQAAAVGRAPGVASVLSDQGALLDVGNRRLLIRAHSRRVGRIIQASQLIEGDYQRASSLLRGGGWATVSSGFAKEEHLRVGDRFRLPTFSGELPLRVAAITTNLGWPPGAITLNTADFRRGWQTDEPTALEVNLKSGVSQARGRQIVAAALGDDHGLQILTAAERQTEADGSLRQGLKTLGEISILLLITGALAIAASLSAAIWQRRTRLASMKTWGYDDLQLWRGLLLESVLVLGVGCVTGAVLGMYGHALANRYLRLSTGFPAPFSVGLTQIVFTLLIVTGIALAVIAVPGLTAARVSPTTSFQE